MKLFGLDINICIWYALEVYEYLNKYEIAA